MKKTMAAALAAAVGASALAVIGAGPIRAQETPELTEDVILDGIEEALGTDLLDRLLETELNLEGPLDGTLRQITIPFGEALASVTGLSVFDEDYTGIGGTPQLSVGNVLHVYADARAFPGFTTAVHPRTEPAPPNPLYRPSDEDLTYYEVRESGLSPNTPLLPVINPLILTGDDAGLGALLLTHPGGRLTTVQGSGWDLPEDAPGIGITTGFHSAGSIPALGNPNVDTAPRDEEDGIPIYVPYLHEGTLMLPDSSIDFMGFAMTLQGATCISLQGTVNIPFTQSALTTYLGWACVSLGTLLGHGAATYDGSPVSFGDLPLLWDEVPAEVAEVIAVVDDAIAEVPVGDVLEEVLGLLGTELPDLDDLDVASGLATRGLSLGLG